MRLLAADAGQGWCRERPRPRLHVFRASSRGRLRLGMTRCSDSPFNAERAAWLERAAELGEPEAMDELADWLWSGKYLPENKERARRLWIEAAELGNGLSQFEVAEKCFESTTGGATRGCAVRC